MTVKENMQIKIPEDEHWWFASRTRAIFSVLDGTVPRGGQEILDVGCGAGNMIHHLERYGNVTGVDSFERPLFVARGRGYKVLHASGENMPFDDEKFDLVTALDVVEHCPDDQAILNECGRVCKEGGYLLVTTPAFQWLWSHNDDVNGHRRRYSAGELRARLDNAGFTIKRLAFNNFFVFPAASALILARSKGKAAPQIAAPSTDEEAYQVEMEPASPLVNSILTAVGKVEAALLGKLDLPVGTSILCLAQKRAKID